MRLIDADALNDMINRSYPMTDRIDVHNGYAICQEMIKQLPTIEERKRGEWIDDGLDSIGFMGIEYRLQKCSNCGETIAKAPMQRLPNFCSNCGAEMRKGEEE